MAPSRTAAAPPIAVGGLARAILEAMPAEAAILDRRGIVVAANAAWQAHWDQDCGPCCLRGEGCGVGTDYLRASRQCPGLATGQSPDAAEEMLAVLEGRAARVSREFGCPAAPGNRWYVLDAQPLEDPNGACLVTHWDISERKAQADALRESRDMHEALVRNSLDAVLLSEPGGRILIANPAAAAMFRLPAETLLTRTRAEILDIEDHRLAPALTERERSGHFRGELRFRRGDGSLFPGEVSSSVFTDRAGRRLTSTVIRDVGEWQRVAEALQEREGQYRQLFESMAQGAFVQRGDGALVDINPAGLALLGLTRDEFLGRTSMHPAWRVVREDGSEWPGDQFPSMLAAHTGLPVTDQVAGVFNPRRGEFVWLIVNAFPRFRDGETMPAEVIVTLQDITESRRYEQEILATRARLALAVEGADLGTYDADLRTREVIVNARYPDILGYPPGEWGLTVDVWQSLIHPEDLRTVLSRSEESIARGTRFDCEYRMRARDGRWTWVLDRGKPVEFDAHGTPTRVGGTLMDITPRKAAEQALRASEASYRSLVEASPDAIWVFLDGRISVVNRAGLSLLGAGQAEDLLGCDVFEFVPDEFRALLRRLVGRLRTGQRNLPMEIPLRRVDGGIVHVEAASAPIVSQGRPAALVVARDISERRRAREKIASLRAELGQFLEWQVAAQTAAAIAHDINQPLNSITTYGEAARRMIATWSAAPPRLAEAIEGMTVQSARAGAVVRELLASFGRTADTPAVVDLRAIVEDAVTLVTADTGRPIAIDGGSVSVAVRVRRSQAERVLANLLHNAVEAVKAVQGNGKDAYGIAVRWAVEGATARVSVIDRGPGTAPEDAGRLFQPYFTTKPHGIGMGLAISRSLVQAHGGLLWHEPTPGGGATFHFTLPLA
ncbi:MAG: PAS domain S-box protein [Rhodocyclaceae bacterium]|nr:PAS domain S-box protein [Rhodocyclaceae bacterium]